MSLVRFDRNDYSVPTQYAHREVTVVGSLDRVRIVADSHVIAEHVRDWESENVHYDPVHYLALLERKPNSLDFGKPFEAVESARGLRACFAGVWNRKAAARAAASSSRSCVSWKSITLRELADAIDRALEIGAMTVDVIRILLQEGRESPAKLFRLDGRPHLQDHNIPEPQISQYSDLLQHQEQTIMKKLETKSTVLLKHHLKALKMPTMHDECEKIAARCAKENVDHLGFLLQLCEQELIDREKRAADRRLKAAKFPNYKTLEDFKFEAQPTINRVLVSELMRGEYIEKRESVILIGHPGTGKTHIATALGIAACGQGKKVRFHRVTELITQLMEAREERQLMRMKNQLAKLDLLILDELGYVPASKLGSELLFDVISAAYERTSVIVTTNLPFEQWTEVLGSQRLTGAVLDRLTHHCHILEATGESYRLKDARKRSSKTKEPAEQRQVRQVKQPS